MPVQPIDYATGPRRHARHFTVAHMTIWLSVASLTALVMSFVVMPRFEEIFKDFVIELPRFTRLVLTLAYWCRDILAFVAMLLPMISLGGGLSSSPRPVPQLYL